ncbi:rIIA protein [Caulobacter phage Seuss]|uniref:RIIA protein n=1 Tax=Caulobacter phage Seuss TaxID=1675601 RepID=A0A0K1LN21_9CAUD|nr:RIIA lysis inhibitor [Caulobacter phage Seuss]AKU43613.1 rIIA protein [Caulobacter phage Seuss]
MKLDALKRNVEVSADLETSKFSIQASPQMFSVLADKMYSNKPLAVLREYCCNAIDAHAMNGNKAPWKVALPSPLDPNLIIRDFGPGMNHVQVMTEFTSFGLSTKTTDNGQIGGFGLGCKSGFAYSDALGVTSFQDGVKRSYAAFRGPDGVPQMSLLGEEETDEPSGLEIRIPIRDHDFRTFIATAEQLLKHFEPGTFEAYGVTVTPDEYVEEHDGYKVRKTNPTASEGRYLLMGPVAYQLDWTKILKEGEDQLPLTVIPVFQIGELDLQPSREGLSYDPKTIGKIRARYDAITKVFAKRLIEKASKMTPYGRIQYINELKRNNTWSWAAKDIGQMENEYTLEGNPELYRWNGKKEGFSTSRIGHGTGGLIADKLRLGQHDLAGNYGLGSVFFIIDDMPDEKSYRRRVTARFKNLVDGWHSGARIYFYDYVQTRANPPPPFIGPLRPKEKPPATADWEMAQYEMRPPAYTDKETLLKALHGIPNAKDKIFFLSELELPLTEKEKLAHGVSKVRVLGYLAGKSRHSWTNNGSYWKEQDDEVEGGMYVPMKGYELDYQGVPYEKYFDSPFIAGEMIFGMSKKAQAQIMGSANEEEFIRVDAEVNARFHKAISDPDIAAAVQARIDYQEATDLKDPQHGLVLRIMESNIAKELFPGIAEALCEVRPEFNSSDMTTMVDRVLDHYRRFQIPKPKPTKGVKTRLQREIKKALGSSALLQLAVQIYEYQRNNILEGRVRADQHTTLQETLATLAKVKLKRKAQPNGSDLDHQ